MCPCCVGYAIWIVGGSIHDWCLCLLCSWVLLFRFVRIRTSGWILTSECLRNWITHASAHQMPDHRSAMCVDFCGMDSVIFHTHRFVVRKMEIVMLRSYGFVNDTYGTCESVYTISGYNSTNGMCLRLWVSSSHTWLNVQNTVLWKFRWIQMHSTHNGRSVNCVGGRFRILSPATGGWFNRNYAIRSIPIWRQTQSSRKGTRTPIIRLFAADDRLTQTTYFGYYMWFFLCTQKTNTNVLNANEHEHELETMPHARTKRCAPVQPYRSSEDTKKTHTQLQADYHNGNDVDPTEDVKRLRRVFVFMLQRCDDAEGAHSFAYVLDIRRG